MLLTQLPSPLLILGPAHSGKSEIAVRCLDPHRETVVIGTAAPLDAQMSQRIATLKSQRPSHWQTRESSRDVASLVAARPPRAEQLLVDAINLWLATDLVREIGGETEEKVCEALLTQIDELTHLIADAPRLRTVLVSAELGAASAPANPVERAVRRLVGLANQRLAARAATVVSMTAGIPVILKNIS